jgi:luciferase family oxidoreductase group 1
MSVTLSVLDLAVLTDGSTAAEAISRTLRVAQHVEKEGYQRIWVAEHHNMANIASSATAVLIGHLAQQTSSIRVGSGGIMLPNHAPLVVAEQFGTLGTLYPGRIDLGLGRAPGTDQLTAAALRRNFAGGMYDFGAHIRELQQYFGNTDEHARVRAFPGEGVEVPIWILGSSTDSAYLAAEMGLPYAFAAHFAPAQLYQALAIYHRHFQPSRFLEQPRTMACVNVVAADTTEEARYLATSIYQMFLGIITNNRRGLQPPVTSMEGLWDLQQQAAVHQMTACTFVGDQQSLSSDLTDFLKATRVDELMINTNVYDLEAKLHSYSLLKAAIDG